MEYKHGDLLRKVLADRNDQLDETPEHESGFDLKSAGPLELQQMIGNRATGSLLSDHTSGGAKAGKSFIQTKLTVTAADDVHEAEADATAKEVVSKGLQRQAMEEEEVGAKRLQRQAMEEEEVSAKRLQRQEMEEEEVGAKRIQRDLGEDDDASNVSSASGPSNASSPSGPSNAPGPSGPSNASSPSSASGPSNAPASGPSNASGPSTGSNSAVDDDISAKRIQRAKVDMNDSFSVGGNVEQQIKSSQGGGQPLADNARSQLEAGMGYDFSNVNVHTDSQADTLNRSLQARAFTYGNDIYFRHGEYNPDSTQGKELLAHELTHTVQQGAVRAKREDS